MQLKIQIRSIGKWRGFFGLLALVWASFAASGAGTWAPLQSGPSDGGGIGTMLLLPDGTVMAARSGTSSQWYRLRPDTQGHYVSGTWSNLASMTYTRLYDASAVLQDGRVFVAGGEYGTGTTNAEVYDPSNNAWSPVPVPFGLITTNNTLDPKTGANTQGFMDCGCISIANGQVMVSPVKPGTSGRTVLFDPVLNTLSQGPVLVNGDTDTDEQTWVKLPDDSILTFDSSEHSQRYIPSLNRWIPDADLPVQLYDNFDGEIGPALLLPDGRAFFLGANGNTVLYAPTGNTNRGSWTTGPMVLNGQGAPDAPAAMMPNGKILCAVSDTPAFAQDYPSPTSFYEYDYTYGTTGKLTQVQGPTGLTLSAKPYNERMLMLPDGNILFTSGGSQLYVYQPDGSPVAAGKPAITSITANANGSFHITGTLLNGISQGAAYGDDAQMDSNYPIIGLTDSGGHVHYARSLNWSSTGVMTGASIVSADFILPSDIMNDGPSGYSLTAIANGISSDAVTFHGPTWVDFNYTGVTQLGTFSQPYNTLALGINAVPAGGTIAIKPGSSHERMTISKSLTMAGIGGSAIIGE